MRDIFVKSQKEKKKNINLLFAIIWSILFILIGEIIAQIVILFVDSTIKENNISNRELIILFCTLTSCIFIILTVIFRVKIYEKRKLSNLRLEKKNFFKKYIKGFIIGLILMSLVILMLYIFKAIEIEKNPSQLVGIGAIGNVLLISIGWMIQGAAEEIVTRGWLMNVLEERYNQVFAVVVSSSLFGLLHLGNPGAEIIAIVNIILVGFVFSLYVIYTEDLWGACAMHSAWNLAQGNIFGFEVSGINAEVGSLLDFNSTGSKLLTGGTFGPEAGIATTVVLSIFIVILLIMIKNKKLYIQK